MTVGIKASDTKKTEDLAGGSGFAGDFGGWYTQDHKRGKWKEWWRNLML